MTSQAKKVLEEMQVRKSSREKREFRTWLTGELEGAGWTVTEERGLFAGHNLIAGGPEKAEILYTAHYDTQAVLPVSNFITPRNLSVYLLYQLLLCLPLFLVIFAIGVGTAMLEAPAGVGFALGYALCIFFVWWLFFGKANRHTANDNTSGVITLLEVALALPAEDRDRVCLVFFDNEERGMLGSSHFAGKHKPVRDKTLVLNFDCVSDGDFIQFFPSKTLKKDAAALQMLEEAFLSGGSKQVEVVRASGFYPSDNFCFRRSCGVCALKRGKFGYYLDRIHTGRDTVFQAENIELLKAGCLRLAGTLKARREKGENRYGNQS